MMKLKFWGVRGSIPSPGPDTVKYGGNTLCLEIRLPSQGRLIIVEYNVDRGNTWVPYPISFKTWEVLARRNGFANTQLLARRPSSFLREIYAAQGIDVRFADDDSPAALEKLIDENTRAVFLESIGNPAGNVADIEAIAKIPGSPYSKVITAIHREHLVPLRIEFFDQLRDLCQAGIAIVVASV